MPNHWTWDFDADDVDFTEFSDIPHVSQNMGMLAMDKMKIMEDDEQETTSKTPKLTEEEELIEELRASGIQYKEELTTNQNCVKNLKWEDENKSKIIFHGNVPVFLGTDHFFIAKVEPKKKKKQLKHAKTKKVETEPEIIGPKSFSSCDDSQAKLLSQPNSLDEPKVLDTTCITSAVELTGVTRRQKKNKKMSFKKFEGGMNFNPEESSGPTIGMADHKYYSSREISIMKRFS